MNDSQPRPGKGKSQPKPIRESDLLHQVSPAWESPRKVPQSEHRLNHRIVNGVLVRC